MSTGFPIRWGRCQNCDLWIDPFYLNHELICHNCRYITIPTRRLKHHFKRILDHTHPIANNPYLRSKIEVYLDFFLETNKNYLPTIAKRLLDPKTPPT